MKIVQPAHHNSLAKFTRENALAPSLPSAPLSPRRKKGAAALASLVPGLVEPVLRQRGFASMSVLTQWAEIVGPHLAQWTTPLEIRWPMRRNSGDDSSSMHEKLPKRSEKQQKSEQAVLVVACPSAFALEFSMGSAGVIEMVNQRLGFGCIGRIEIRQSPRKPPLAKIGAKAFDPALLARIEAGLGNIQDDRLRASLARMKAGILTKSP